MKVLVVIESLGYGGAERLLVSLLPELNKIGIHCEVAVLGEPYSLKSELEHAGIPVHCLDLSHRWALHEALYKLTRIIKSGNGFDLVWGHLWFGNLYAALVKLLIFKLDVVWTFHHAVNFDPALKITLWKRFRKGLERILGSNLVAEKVGVSNAVIADYVREYGWQETKRIYNGIPCISFPSTIGTESRLKIRSDYCIGQSDVLITVPARFVPYKGHLVLCESLKILLVERGWAPKCVAVGNGSYRSVVQSKIEELALGDYMYLYDAIPQVRLFELIQSSEMVVMPSLKEPFGIAAVEAMALGVPTILSDVDGFKEVVGNTDAAVLVLPSDPRALANSIWHVYADSALRARLSVNGKARVYEQFDIPHIARQWSILFLEIKAVSN